jgi:nucleoside-diphosphate-sugar epimerase
VGLAIALACERHRDNSGFDVFNVGEATTPTMSERAEQIARAMGVELAWDEDAEDLPEELSHLGIVPNDIVTTSAKIRAALGFSEVTDEDERVASIVAWARRTSG